MDKTEVIKHMSDSPRVTPFNHRHVDPPPPPPSHEVRSTFWAKAEQRSPEKIEAKEGKLGKTDRTSY
jgi:hypothetical protein